MAIIASLRGRDVCLMEASNRKFNDIDEYINVIKNNKPKEMFVAKEGKEKGKAIFKSRKPQL